MSERPNSISRTSLADLIDACDVSIKDFNDSKREAFTSYRTLLENLGWDKEAIKAEIEAVKIAIKRRRVVKAEGIEVIEGKDELVEEVLTEILTTRAPRATRVEKIEEFGADHDPETGEILDTSSLAKAAHAVSRDDEAGEHQPPSKSGIADADEPGRRTHVSAERDRAPITEPVEGCLPADEAEPPQGEASSVPRVMTMTPLEPREAGGLKGFGFTVKFEQAEGGENVDPQVLGEVETHASPAINPHRPHCLKPKSCASINWKAHCYTCSKEHADAEGFAP